MGAVDSRHLLLVGAGPGLGASVARRFARGLSTDARCPIAGEIAADTPARPHWIADACWAIRNENPGAWREEYRFDGGAPGLSAPPPASSS